MYLYYIIKNIFLFLFTIFYICSDTCDFKIKVLNVLKKTDDGLRFYKIKFKAELERKKYTKEELKDIIDKIEYEDDKTIYTKVDDIKKKLYEYEKDYDEEKDNEKKEKIKENIEYTKKTFLNHYMRQKLKKNCIVSYQKIDLMNLVKDLFLHI